jgi:hypothetical protein
LHMEIKKSNVWCLIPYFPSTPGSECRNF